MKRGKGGRNLTHPGEGSQVKGSSKTNSASVRAPKEDQKRGVPTH